MENTTYYLLANLMSLVVHTMGEIARMRYLRHNRATSVEDFQGQIDKDLLWNNVYDSHSVIDIATQWQEGYYDGCGVALLGNQTALTIQERKCIIANWIIEQACSRDDAMCKDVLALVSSKS